MPALRASDADRDACIEQLEAAFADGRLTDLERTQRVGRALTAATRRDLAALTTDLDAHQPRATGPATGTAAAIGAVCVVALVLIGGVVGLIWTAFSPGSSSGSSSGSPGVPLVSDEPSLALHTVDGFSTFIDRTRERFGSTRVVRAVVYPDYASVDVPVAGSPNRIENWYFKSQYADEVGNRSSRGSESSDVDLTSVDLPALVAHLDEAASELGVVDPTSVYAIIEDDDVATYAIYVSNEYSESGYWRFTLDGTEVARSPFRP